VQDARYGAAVWCPLDRPGFHSVNHQ
jgi:hypothetical protein